MNSIKGIDEDGLEKLRDGELLKLIANRGEQGERAFDAFYSRYIKDFYKKVCRISLDENVIQELVSETMEQVYYKAHTFKAEEGIDSDAERRRTLAWLGKIAHRIFLQKLRDQEKDPETVSMDSDNFEGKKNELLEKMSENGFITKANLNHIIRESGNKTLGIINTEREAISPHRKTLREVMSRLPEREKDILLNWFEEYDPRIKNQKLPRKTIKNLRERYNVTPDYIRKIKERTFKAVREKCLDLEKAESKYEQE